jgi:hypothetical protein
MERRIEMPDQINDELIDKFDMKFSLHRTNVEKTDPCQMHQDSTLHAKINKSYTCTSPMPCENCEHFVNDACFKGKNKF